MTKKLFLLIFIFFQGCTLGLGNNVETTQFFVLNDSCQTDPPPLEKRNLRLVVRDATSSRFLNSQRIIFSSNPSSRSYYKFSRWVQPPAQRFSLLLRRRLERCGMFETVSRRSSAAVGDIQINTEILEFFHDTEQEPGYAKISVNVELLSLKNFEIIHQKDFNAEVEVQSYDINGAIDGFNIAISQVLDELIIWINQNIENTQIKKIANSE